MKKTALSRQSKKRQVESRIYNKKRIIFLKERPLCEFLKQGTGRAYHFVEKCENRATEIHHSAGRAGKNYLDDSRWFAMCAFHHRFLHEHGTWARLNGWITT